MKKILSLICAFFMAIAMSFTFVGCGTTGVYTFDGFELLGAEFSTRTVNNYLSRMTDAEKELDIFVPILELLRSFEIELLEEGKGNICIGVSDSLIKSLIYFTSDSDVVEDKVKSLQDGMRSGGENDESQTLNTDQISGWLTMLKNAKIKVPFKYTKVDKDVQITLLSPMVSAEDVEQGVNDKELHLGQMVNMFMIGTGYGIDMPDTINGTISDDKVELVFKAVFPKIAEVQFDEESGEYLGVMYEDTTVEGINASLTSMIAITFVR